MKDQLRQYVKEIENIISVSNDCNFEDNEQILEIRLKMLVLLSDFYRNFIDDEDDFIILFAIYCNLYIRYNFHQLLPEKDFGIFSILENIKNDEMKEYLSLIQNGIYNQDISYFYKASDLKPKYSLSYVYLFIYSVKRYAMIRNKTDNIKDFDSFIIVDYFNKIEKDLQDYVLGKNNSVNNDIYENNLPCLKVLNNDDDLSKFVDKSQVDKFKNNFEDKNIKKDFLNSDIIGDRLLYLGIPTIVFQFDFLSVVLEQNKLYKDIFYTQRENGKIIKDFAHKYKNMKATNLYDVAQILLKEDVKEYRNLGNMILLEYINKTAMTEDVYIMQMMYEKRLDELRNALKNSLADSSYNLKLGIKDVINKSLVFDFINIFYNVDDKFRIIRNNFKNIWKKLVDYRNKFQEDVIFNNEDCVNWLFNNGIKFNININSDWNLVFLKPENYAFVFLKDIFQEIFLNYFYHGNLLEPITFNLSSDNSSLIVNVENNFKSDSGKAITTKLGLSSLASVLPFIYKEKVLLDDVLRYRENGDIFILEIKIPKDVFIKCD